tara:strand:+ start:438 stop:1325 length:888 start_codon:yes stop_codon:yes gene_type:complete
MAFTKVLGPGIHTLSNITSHNIHSSGIVTAVSFVGDGSSLTGIANTDYIVGTAITMGTGNFTGNLTVGGVLTYEDVKNVDSVGLGTFREGIFLPDNKKIELGNAAGSGDLQLYHDGGHSRIVDYGTGNLVVQTDGFRLRSTDQTEVLMMASKNNSVDLYYDNVKKFETSAKGIKVGTGVTIETNGQATYTGIVTATAFQLADGSAIGAGAGGTWSSYTAGIATSKSVGVNTSNLDDNDLVGVGNSFQGLYISNGMLIHDNTLNGNHYIGTSMNGLMAGPVNIEGTLTIDGNYVVV